MQRPTGGTPIRTRSTDMIGRQRERGLLEEALDFLDAGRAHTILVEGEAGIGKTRLVEHLRQLALDRGARVLTGRADDLERSRVLGPALDALAGGPDDEGRAALAEAATQGAPEDRLIELSIEAVERWAADGALVLIVEDLHWADPATVTALRTIGRRLSYLPVLIAATYRPHPHPDALRRFVDAASGDGATIIGLAPLEQQEALSLAHALLGTDVTGALEARIATAAGNPLFVTEVAASLIDEGLLERGDADAMGSIPSSLRLTILRRLSYLPSDALEALRMASVLGSSFAIDDLAAVTGSSVPATAAALEPAFRSRVLGEDGDAARFRHDLLRESIYEDIAAPVRASLHLHVASVLHDRDAQPERVGEHLLRIPGDAEPRVLDLIDDVAGRIGTTKPKLACDLLEHGVRLAGTDDERADRYRIAMLWPLEALGRGEETIAIAEELLARPREPEDEGAIRLVSTRARQRLGRSAETYDSLVAMVDDDRFPPEQLIVARALLAAAYVGMGRPEEARALANQVIAESGAANDRETLGGATYWAGIAAMMQGYALEAVEQMKAAYELSRQRRLRLASGHLGYGITLLQADRIEDARRVLNEGRQRDRQAGSASDLAPLTSILCAVEAEAGRWDDAVAEGLTAIRLVNEEGGSAIAVFASYAILALISLHRGDRAEAERYIDEGFAILADRGPGPVVDGLFWVKALCQEDAGDLQGALDTAWGAWQLLESVRFAMLWRFSGPDLVRLSLAVGERERAEAVAAEVEEGARRAAGIVGAEATALRVRGLLQGDPDMLVEAAGHLRALGFRVEHVGCVEDAARSLVEHGRAAEARPLFEEALTLYESVGATRSVARVSAAMRAAGIRRGTRSRRARPVVGWAALTPSEVAVARMAAEGLTNPQIAERLVVSKYTVMTHLQHVFAKLQISSRVELASRVARDDTGS